MRARSQMGGLSWVKLLFSVSAVNDEGEPVGYMVVGKLPIRSTRLGLARQLPWTERDMLARIDADRERAQRHMPASGSDQ